MNELRSAFYPVWESNFHGVHIPAQATLSSADKNMIIPSTRKLGAGFNVAM
jgi:hypothetical protein